MAEMRDLGAAARRGLPDGLARRGLDLLTRKLGIPVAASRGTLAAIAGRLQPATERIALHPRRSVRFADVAIEAIALPHDAAEPTGFRLSCGPAQLGLVTDLGMITPQVADGLDGLTALVVEANHDIDLLRQGPYPRWLKRRLLSPTGHLSNDALGEFLRKGPIDQLALLYLAREGITLESDPEDPYRLRFGKATLERFRADDGGYVAADDRGYQFLLDYRDGPGAFPSFSLSELLDGRLDGNVFRDRMVLLHHEKERKKMQREIGQDPYLYTPD